MIWFQLGALWDAIQSWSILPPWLQFRCFGSRCAGKRMSNASQAREAGQSRGSIGHKSAYAAQQRTHPRLDHRNGSVGWKSSRWSIRNVRA